MRIIKLYEDYLDDEPTFDAFENQEYKSFGTNAGNGSRNTSYLSGKSGSKPSVPTLFTTIKFKPGTLNLDYGCGQPSTFRVTSDILAQQGVEDVPYDPDPSCFPDRSVLTRNTYDTVTCANVLNVLPESSRIEAISNAYRILKPGGTYYAQVDYVKDYITNNSGRKVPSGVGRHTGGDKYQANMDIQTYANEISHIFPDVKIGPKKIIIATK